MDDDIIAQIDQLIEEEHRLRATAVDELSPDDHARIEHLDTRLDQCWDLLRQRRAKRDAGQNPADAHTRSEQVVEGYQQ